MSDWQPIETAPKDGTEILAAYMGPMLLGAGADYSLVRWERGGWLGQCDGQRAIESQGDCYTDYFQPYVTHWMPLPPPPEDQS